MIPSIHKLVLGSPFQDNVVLQRGRPIVVWGWDAPQQRIVLRVSDSHAETTAGDDGRWQLTCPELAEGGPYFLTIEGSSQITLHNVLVGEVWLASGQSNMQWHLGAIKDAESEIARANYPQIRMFTALNAASASSNATVNGEWVECNPNTADSFSAIGYLFARELHERLGVPVGILHASWGGTPIEAWASIEALQKVIDVDGALARQAEVQKDAAHLEAIAIERAVEWERTNLPADPGNTGVERGWADLEFDDAGWPTMRVPAPWQSRGLEHNGVVWFRRIVEIPADWCGSDLVVTLGAIDDFDTTYFNGRQIGSHPKGTPEAYRLRRRYLVPKELVRPGRAVIAVRVFDHFGEGGLMGPASLMKLGPEQGEHEPIRLSGDWKYQVEHAIDLVPASVFQSYPRMDIPLPQYRLSALYNGMIAPLVGFTMRGAIWYQGESNANQNRRYRDLMIAMIRDWRSRWGLGQFPFVFVQLPNYRGGADWPYLREAQAQVSSEPNTAMAVTIDVGDDDDIHPHDKQPVAHRLALHALALCHAHDRSTAFGPALSRVEIIGSMAYVILDNATGLTTGNDEEVLGFELAGEDGVYCQATATIDVDRVVLQCRDVPAPVAVRYAWSDTPSVNLRNAAGLPAMPFRTDCR